MIQHILGNHPQGIKKLIHRCPFVWFSLQLAGGKVITETCVLGSTADHYIYQAKTLVPLLLHSFPLRRMHWVVHICIWS